MYTTLIQNHPALKDLRIYYGQKSFHYLTEFSKCANRLGSDRAAAWCTNLMIGLNHGYIDTALYLTSLLDYMEDEHYDRTHQS